MFYKNTLFFVFKNIKQKTVYDYHMCFPVFLFWEQKTILKISCQTDHLVIRKTNWSEKNQ